MIDADIQTDNKPQFPTNFEEGTLTMLEFNAKRSAILLAVAAPLWMSSQCAWAGDRLLGTWGVSQVEGAGGGGLVPWATMAGTGSSNQNGGAVFATRLKTQGGYELKVAGAAVGIQDKVELSMARWSFKLGDVVPNPNTSLEMTSVGAKVRVAGDAVYDQDTWMPQVSVGVQYKQSSDPALVRSLGAQHTSDFDVYVAATKLWLGAVQGHNLITNVTLRMTRANQFGLVGFGGPGDDSHKMQLETSAGVMLTDNLVLGGEYRSKPNNLQTSPSSTVLKEDDAYDVFVAWFPWRHASLTLAWVNLGNLVGKGNQGGVYVSGQAAF